MFLKERTLHAVGGGGQRLPVPQLEDAVPRHQRWELRKVKGQLSQLLCNTSVRKGSGIEAVFLRG